MLFPLILAALLQATPPAEPTPQNPPVPDVTGWTRTPSRDLELRAGDYTTVFVGQIAEYRNPQDPGAYVLVYLRHYAVTSRRALEREDTDRRGQTGSDLKYHANQERMKLERVRSLAEPFGYIAGRTVRDTRLGQDIPSGPVQSWLLSADGEWAYASGAKIRETTLSEPPWDDHVPFLLAGLVFKLGPAEHILRADPAHLLKPIRPKKTAEKKEGTK